MKTTKFVLPAVIATGVALFAGTGISHAQNSSYERGGNGTMQMAQGQGQGYGMRRGMGRGMGMGQGGGGHQGNRVRHRVVRHQGIPEAYMDKKNPLVADAATIKLGKQLYADNCASCHGAKGVGDGEAGRELSPPPANIAFIMDKWIATDPFLFWAISEGGEPLQTDMPAFKDALSEKQRWSIIHYLRNGLGG